MSEHDTTFGGRAGRVLTDRGLLDLSGLSSPDELDTIAAIERVGTVVVPRSLAAAYAAIPVTSVGSSIFVPEGARVRSLTGSVQLGGDELGEPNDVLIVTGSLVITSPVTGDLPALIHVSGSVLVPRGSESTIGRVLEGSGSVTGYRWVEGQQFETMAGQLSIGPGRLANAFGEPDDLLLLAGQLVITGPVGDVGYRQIVCAGQVAAPLAARDTLEPRMVVHGQCAWYATDQPRVCNGSTDLTAAFLELLERPCSLIVQGRMLVADDVTAELLREKVNDIVLFGEITAPPPLVPIVQFLAEQAFGPIRGTNGSTD